MTGIIVEFSLQCYVAPPVVKHVEQFYRISDAGVVAQWARDIKQDRSNRGENIEMAFIMGNAPPHVDRGGAEDLRVAMLQLWAFCDSDSEAKECLALVN